MSTESDPARDAERDTARDAAPPRAVLALNSGSSSLKFGLYLVSQSQAEVLLAGTHEAASIGDQADAVRDIINQLAAHKLPAPEVIGHRVVHGGAGIQQHVLITAAVLQQLEAAAAFAPLHAPAALAVIRLAQKRFAGTPHVACLDTVFHADMPAAARTLPIDRALQAEGLRRYGFHGLSCESVVQQLGPDLPERLVIAHLGHGASVTAVRHGRSAETSMGLTPAGGTMMGTRSGDLDPGLLVYLMRERAMDAAAIDALINHRSGLIGVSGVASDLRQLHAAAASNPDAALAVEMFCLGVRKQVAAMAAVLGGIDLLVFTGGIGENDARVRDAVCAGLAWIAGLAVRVLPSQEDAQIARHAAAIGGGRVD